VHVSKDLLLCK